MSSKKRRYFTSEKKAQIVRRHLADKVAIDTNTARRLFTLLCALHFRG